VWDTQLASLHNQNGIYMYLWRFTDGGAQSTRVAPPPGWGRGHRGTASYVLYMYM
jgi:hypothetical protein